MPILIEDTTKEKRRWDTTNHRKMFAYYPCCQYAKKIWEGDSITVCRLHGAVPQLARSKKPEDNKINPTNKKWSSPLDWKLPTLQNLHQLSRMYAHGHPH
jgi:hypothetical protein